MSRHLGIAIMTVCAVFVASGGGAPAFSEEVDAAQLLFDGSKLLSEQQEVDAKLAINEARVQELALEQQRTRQRAEQVNNERQANQDECATSALYYTHRMDCNQGSIELPARSAEVDVQQHQVGRQLEATSSEVELLKARREQLKRQAEGMELKLKRLELSGTAQECVSRLPKDDLASMVSAYQQCWDGTSTAEPHLKPKSPTGASVGGIGPIEQMGIEQEKRRKRRARQQEAQ